MTTETLGTSLSLIQIKENVRDRKSMEFTASASQVNLDKIEIKGNINLAGNLEFPLINNKKEIFNMLWNLNVDSDSLQWDYITLLTYLNDGQICYKLFKDDIYLVTIYFKS